MKRKLFLKLAAKSLLILAVTLVTSCKSDDNNPVGIVFVDLPSGVLGQYTGDLVYTSGTDAVVTEDGTATISGTGTYTINFSDGVPSITSLRFILSDGEYVSVIDDGITATGVVIANGSLSVADANNGSISFDGNK